MGAFIILMNNKNSITLVDFGFIKTSIYYQSTFPSIITSIYWEMFDEN